jgi:hypothetical protein
MPLVVRDDRLVGTASIFVRLVLPGGFNDAAFRVVIVLLAQE